MKPMSTHEASTAAGAAAGPFGRGGVWLAVVAGVSLLVGVLVEMFGDPPGVHFSTGSDSFSKSSVGHRAFVETLRRCGVNVLVSRHDSGAKAGSTGVLAILESGTGDSSGLWADEVMWPADRVFMVCPKWASFPQRERPGWVEAVRLHPDSIITQELASIGIEVEVVRPPRDDLEWSRFQPYEFRPPRSWDFFESPGDSTGDTLGHRRQDTLGVEGPIDSLGFEGEGDQVSTSGDSTATDDEPGLEPSATIPPRVLLPRLHRPQLLRSEQLAPVLACPEGILVGAGWADGTRVVVVADPDLIANHGLHRGDNALVALQSLGLLRERDEIVIVDESLHGHAHTATVWREMLRFPLVLVSIHIAIVVLLLLIATMTRYGSPVVAAPTVRPGKEYLIDNTAAMLQYGHHSAHALQRYFTRTLQDVHRRLRGPEAAEPDVLRAWLQSMSTSRGSGLDLAALEREIRDLVMRRSDDAKRILAAAGRIHRWRQEMLHES